MTERKNGNGSNSQNNTRADSRPAAQGNRRSGQRPEGGARSQGPNVPNMNQRYAQGPGPRQGYGQGPAGQGRPPQGGARQPGYGPGAGGPPPRNGRPGYNQGPYGQPYGQGAPRGARRPQEPGRGPARPAGGYRPPAGRPPVQQPPRKKGKKRVMFAVEILALLVLAVGLFVFSKFTKLRHENVGDVVLNENIPTSEADLMKQYTNIVLYGVDSRDGNLTTDAHSDTIMIASINNKTKDVKLVSVYRDTYLDNTNGEYRKATECYYFGGPERSRNMLNKNLDLNIEDFVTVNFNAVVAVVDRLGGIELDITDDEVVYINDYSVENKQVTGVDYENLTQSGLQTVNGIQALAYCRIRYGGGDDFKRTERQRLVLSKIIEKVKNTDPLTLNGIIDDVLPEVATSLSTTEILSLATNAASYNFVDTTGFPFDQTPMTIPSRNDCVVPNNLANNVQQLHQWMFGSEDYTPSATVQEISNKIINETGVQ